jgi:hypothetical protein
MFRQAQFDRLCLQGGSNVDRDGNRRMPLRMPELTAEGRDNSGWLGTEGGGVYECRWDGLLWLAGRGVVLLYIPSRKP